MIINQNLLFSFLALLNIITIYCDDNLVKIRVVKGVENQEELTLNINTSEEIPKTRFHFLLLTIGRKSILNMIESLRDQVSEEDIFTIVFDGRDKDNIFEKVKDITANFNCKVNVIYEKENYGYWGHKLKNEKYSNLEGDFVLHCDDDDIYMPNTIKIAKRICTDKNKLYLFKICSPNFIVWDEPKIAPGNIGSTSGIIPTKLNNLGNWGYSYVGDYEFYSGLAHLCNEKDIVFVDLVIYKVIDDTPYKTY